MHNYGNAEGNIRMYAHKEKRSIVSLKLCRNLCSRKLLRPRRSGVNNFNPRGWWILYINAGLGRINLSSARLNISMEEEFRMFGSSWFQLRVDEGNNVDLKRSVLMKGAFGG